ncbi:response regulator transcription factor [Phycicoccus sp. CSK15P-2]|uniref:response regulator n=1 Tax=Phycicoccus sp. CSK15P-2 TaxID=2807627 RepID=UPI00194EC159|nr:response regulator transcription factor [Phycicoccus sp. CSK15P-2]MBM6405522.1 response regulator transcription factor [Phycicoccus sp. CSK15P-2]
MTDDPALVRVVVVDDDPLVRSALRLMLGGHDDIVLVGEAADGEEALDVVGARSPDVVLMDIRMPRRDGLDATRVLLARAGAPRVLVLTTFDTDDLVLRALRAGAAGFLLKDTPPAQVVHAVRAVAAGEPMLSPSVTTRLIAAVTEQEPRPDRRREAARAALSGLTERERDVADAVARGLSNAQIGAELYLSTATVKAHVGRIFTKVGTDNRVQVALLVRDAEQGHRAEGNTRGPENG